MKICDRPTAECRRPLERDQIARLHEAKLHWGIPYIRLATYTRKTVYSPPRACLAVVLLSTMRDSEATGLDDQMGAEDPTFGGLLSQNE